MLRLLVKDFIFNKKQVFFGVIFTVFISLAIKDGQQYAAPAFFMSAAFLFNQFVGKSCYMDDKNNVYTFLKSLPISKSTIVISKFAEGLISLVMAIVFALAVKAILQLTGSPQFQFEVPLFLMIISILLIYIGVYLWLFFKYNFATAQHAMPVIFLTILIIFKIQDYLKNFINISITPDLSFSFSYIILLIAIVLFTFSLKFSVEIFNTRE